MDYVSAFLNSFSQVFLYENKFFGFLIFLSLLIIQPRLGIFSTVAVIIGIVFSSVIGVDNFLIGQGIIGFNAVLIGIACAYFLPKNEIALIATFAFVAFGILLQLGAQKYFQTPVFTLPFVLAALILFFIKNRMNQLF